MEGYEIETDNLKISRTIQIRISFWKWCKARNLGLSDILDERIFALMESERRKQKQSEQEETSQQEDEVL